MSSDAELILNPDGSIYHLDLLPGDLATTIITVGDQHRVDRIAERLDHIHLSKQKREFKTVTGRIGSKDVSIISTGIGTDNVDIVLNEIDALFNVDLETKQIHRELQSLRFIRLGTSGCIQRSIPVDSILISKYAIGMGALMNYYQYTHRESEVALLEDLQLNADQYYMVESDPDLFESFSQLFPLSGISLTANGFYGPQGRSLRLASNAPFDFKKYEGYEFRGSQLTNIEMETAGLYGLGQLMNHQCISISALLANRITGEFSNRPKKPVDIMIDQCLELIAHS